MKKYILIAIIFAAALVVLPSKTQAQYNPYIYNNNAYLQYALASQRARARGRKKVVRKTARKRVVRKARRVSSLEDIVIPKFRIESDLPKKAYTV
jgi:hypothetical protein